MDYLSISRIALYIWMHDTCFKRKGTQITNLTRTVRFLSETRDLIVVIESRGKQFLIVGIKNKATDSVVWTD